MRAWFFTRTLEDIMTAYRASSNALAVRPNEIEAEARKLLGIGFDEDFPDRDDEDVNDLVGQVYDQAGEMLQQANRGTHIVRKAFLIALFHHWERFCNRELKRDNYSHPRGWLGQRGKSAYAKEIQELERAANCAKHGPGRSCEALFKASPAFFPNVADAEKASELTLVIDEATLERFFDVVKKAAS
jgi:hypothetical protein